jgi:hypothetical protein
MEKMDLNAYGVSEMNQQEMVGVDGGNVFKAVANAVADAAVWVYNIIYDTFSGMQIV